MIYNKIKEYVLKHKKKAFKIMPIIFFIKEKKK